MMERQTYSYGPTHLYPRAGVLLFPIVTLLLAAAAYAGMSMNSTVLLAVLVAGVVCLGLPHGSLDPLVARKLFRTDRRFTMVRFLLAYAILAALCAVSWIASPNIALSIFLGISALHFGSDWQQRGSVWGRAAYGACVVTVPTLHHAESVRQIYIALGATAAGDIVSASRFIAWTAISVAMLTLLLQPRGRRQDWLELSIILIGAIALPPLLFFVCYFCLLHSPRHLIATSREVELHGVGAFLKVVAPTVGATLVLAALLWHLLPGVESNGRMLETVFIGLAALTVPHMLLTELKEHNQRSLIAEPRSGLIKS
jgi:Brp/Blh family beta-carotene 15,15'-monooxygenase